MKNTIAAVILLSATALTPAHAEPARVKPGFCYSVANFAIAIGEDRDKGEHELAAARTVLRTDLDDFTRRLMLAIVKLAYKDPSATPMRLGEIAHHFCMKEFGK